MNQLPDWRPDAQLPSMECGGSSWPGEFVMAVRENYDPRKPWAATTTWVRYTPDD